MLEGLLDQLISESDDDKERKWNIGHAAKHKASYVSLGLAAYVHAE